MHCKRIFVLNKTLQVYKKEIEASLFSPFLSQSLFLYFFFLLPWSQSRGNRETSNAANYASHLKWPNGERGTRVVGFLFSAAHAESIKADDGTFVISERVWSFPDTALTLIAYPVSGGWLSPLPCHSPVREIM